MEPESSPLTPEQILTSHKFVPEADNFDLLHAC